MGAIISRNTSEPSEAADVPDLGLAYPTHESEIDAFRIQFQKETNEYLEREINHSILRSAYEGWQGTPGTDTSAETINEPESEP